MNRAPSPTSTTPTRQVALVMGMPFSLALRGRHQDDAAARRAWALAVADLRRADAVFSPYRVDSWVSLVNRGRARLDDGPPESAEVLALAERARADSDGAFTVHRPGGPGGAGGSRRFDPSGVVKGWAAERAAAHLVSLPGTSVCLSAGGDVLCATHDEDPDGWTVAVQDPSDPHRILATVEVRTGAVATSGTSARGDHLVDGRTGRRPTGIAQVSVVGPTLTGADVAATTAYALGAQAEAWLAERPELYAVLVDPEGRARVSR